jgi:hypothetical protein
MALFYPAIPRKKDYHGKNRSEKAGTTREKNFSKEKKDDREEECNEKKIVGDE